MQYSTVQYSTVQYITVQYSTVQYSTVQYSTVQYSVMLLRPDFMQVFASKKVYMFFYGMIGIINVGSVLYYINTRQYCTVQYCTELILDNTEQ